MLERYKLGNELYKIEDHQYNNHNSRRLILIGDIVISELKKAYPECDFAIGGSLLSGTSIKGKNDVDINMLIPNLPIEESVAYGDSLSKQLNTVIPFKKRLPRKVLFNGGTYVVPMFLHEMKHELESINGMNEDASIEIKIGSKSPKGFSLSHVAAHLPNDLKARYLEQKFQAMKQGNNVYRGIKYAFYYLLLPIYQQSQLQNEKILLPHSRVINLRDLYLNEQEAYFYDLGAEQVKEYSQLEKRFF